MRCEIESEKEKIIKIEDKKKKERRKVQRRREGGMCKCVGSWIFVCYFMDDDRLLFS